MQEEVALVQFFPAQAVLVEVVREQTGQPALQEQQIPVVEVGGPEYHRM